MKTNFYRIFSHQSGQITFLKRQSKKAPNHKGVQAQMASSPPFFDNFRKLCEQPVKKRENLVSFVNFLSHFVGMYGIMASTGLSLPHLSKSQ